MPDPGSFHLIELMSSASSVIVIILAGAVLLMFWQVTILLGSLIANLVRRSDREEGGELRAG
jgi:hypothetical protein